MQDALPKTRFAVLDLSDRDPVLSGGRSGLLPVQDTRVVICVTG